MTVTILLFARYRELAGRSSVTLDLPPRATLAQAWARLQEEHPGLRAEARPLLACNRAYARPERELDGSEEVAAFPPVSGG